jgi:ABC-type transporter Mla MlaB component
MGYMEEFKIENTPLSVETLPSFLSAHEKQLIESQVISLSFDDLDTAGYQFLCSLTKSKANSKETVILNTTPYLCDVLKKFGVIATFNETEYETT